MFDRVVLGIDPGVARLGIAAVARGRDGRARVLAAGTLRTPAGIPAGERLRRVHAAVGEAIREHGAESVAVERLMWGRNTSSAMDVARASGVVLLAAAEAGVPVEEYPPLAVKMAVTGVGNASKEQVRRALRMLVARDAEVPEDPDAADALAVGVCHLTQSPLRRMAREAGA